MPANLTRRSFIAASALPLVARAGSQTRPWNQWRGPNRDGSAPGLSLPRRWPAELKRVWSVPAGFGYSAPVVSGNAVYLHSRDNGNEIVRAIDLISGRTWWEDSYPAPFKKNQYALEMHAGPFATPLLTNGRLFTFGVSAVLSCFDPMSGQILWRRDFSRKTDTSRLFTGAAGSPLLLSGSVIVQIGDDMGGGLLALNVKDGGQQWAWYGDGPGYASPVAANFDGRRAVITLTDKRAVAVDPDDGGALLWSIPFADEWNENIVTPVVANQRFVLFSGVRRGTFVVEPIREQGVWSLRAVWEKPDVAFYMSTPVMDGKEDLLYGFSHRNKGQFVCLNPRTGTLFWTSDGRQGEHASLVSCGDVILALLDDGELRAIRATSNGYRELASYEVASAATWTHLVPAGPGLLIRDDATLSLWNIPG